jgi:hypothetical protein
MRRGLVAIGVAFAIGALVAGVAFAVAPKAIPNDGVFYACYDSGGNVKLIDYSVTQTCPKSWMGPVNWNQTGLTGAANVLFDASHLIPGAPVIRAFVPTGSTSTLCMVTLAETNFAPAGITTFCGQRFLFGQDGVELSIFYPTNYPLPQEVPDFFLSVTLYQNGAQFYGEPIYVPY